MCQTQGLRADSGPPCHCTMSHQSISRKPSQRLKKKRNFYSGKYGKNVRNFKIQIQTWIVKRVAEINRCWNSHNEDVCGLLFFHFPFICLLVPHSFLPFFFICLPCHLFEMSRFHVQGLLWYRVAVAMETVLGHACKTIHLMLVRGEFYCEVESDDQSLVWQTSLCKTRFIYE